MTDIPRAVRWHGDGVRIIDQTRLPAEYVELDLTEVDEVVEAIRSLRVRGAPAIGIAAGMGLVASLRGHVNANPPEFRRRLAENAARIRSARPTAANLGWAIDRLVRLSDGLKEASSPALWEALRAEATSILQEDREMCRRIGEHGLELIPDGATILTHCNAGALATGGIGTAVAPVYAAAGRRHGLRVIATETRPLLQGSRLTAWEMQRAGIDVSVIVDSAVASMMARSPIDLVLVGADRILGNGDVANKIGTYGLAVAARHHGIPFYVAAPSSTFDWELASGEEIPIEQRSADEIRSLFGRVTAPAEVRIENPAFDVTPADLVDAIVTEHGVIRPPYSESLSSLRAAVAPPIG